MYANPYAFLLRPAMQVLQGVELAAELRFP
jgi:hypothetical protein